jgi:hypothetical protein
LYNAPSSEPTTTPLRPHTITSVQFIILCLQ